MRTFRIYGDNIVECERTLKIMCTSLGDDAKVDEVQGSLAIPSYVITYDQNKKIEFVLIPGYGENRWSIDVLKLLEAYGGLLREAPDSLVTEIENKSETILFAIEFCGALPAGNQAWQRNGRALSFAHSKIPYFYMTELGGYELDGDRARKAERLPNPLIPFSYVTISLEKDTPVLPIYMPSAGTSETTNKKYQNIYGIRNLYEYIDAKINNKNTDLIIEALNNKAIKLVEMLADSRRSNDSLSSDSWKNLYEKAKKSDSGLGEDIVKNHYMKWSKKVSIPTTPTFANLLKLAEKTFSGVTASNLPISILEESKRKQFSEELLKIYSANISNEFINWIKNGKGPLALAWIAGFKPKGDDARPDRGLAPLLRMTVGYQCDTMAIVYGPAPSSHISLLKNNQTELGKRNGLWESILKTTNAIIVDCKSKDGICTEHILVNSHLKTDLNKNDHQSSKIQIQKFGEQDVDTSIHILFSKLLKDNVFEGLCNPPGGDWSGISLVTHDLKKEQRWLTLPRVTESSQKRPDHIFQIFGNKKFIIICESKDNIKDIETNIGPRLKNYVSELTKKIADVERANESSPWEHSREYFDFSYFEFITIAAGIINAKSSLEVIAKNGDVDLVMGFDFNKQGSHKIKLLAHTKNGLALQDILMALKQPLNSEITVDLV